MPINEARHQTAEALRTVGTVADTAVDAGVDLTKAAAEAGLGITQMLLKNPGKFAQKIADILDTDDEDEDGGEPSQ